MKLLQEVMTCPTFLIINRARRCRRVSRTASNATESAKRRSATVSSGAGRHAEAAHIRLLLDCVQICATSADFMARGSDLHAETCAVCADVCERCARDCEQFGDDRVMRACAEACRRCGEACRQMAGGMAFRKAA